MSLLHINPWSILAAVAINQAIGFLWFSTRMLGVPWMREMGIEPQDIEVKVPLVPLLISVASSAVLALGLTFVLRMGGHSGLRDGLLVGAVVSVGIMSMGAATYYAFARRSLRLFLIEQGHSALAVVAMSAVLGLWP